MLCILQGAHIARLAVIAFTLSWTHSVEKIRWEEDWRIDPRGLVLVEARTRGSGAGMEPPPDARLEGGWWKYSPGLPPVPEVLLAASGATGSGWEICGAGSCITIGEQQGDPIRLAACKSDR